MKLTTAVHTALIARIEAIDADLRTLRAERKELQDAVGQPTIKRACATRAPKASPNRDAVLDALRKLPPSTPYAIAAAAKINEKSVYSALHALRERGLAHKRPNGLWVTDSTEKTQQKAEQRLTAGNPVSARIHVPGH